MDEIQNDTRRRRRRALVAGVAGGTCLAFGGWGVARDGAPAVRDLLPGLPAVPGRGSDGAVASERDGSSPPPAAGATAPAPLPPAAVPGPGGATPAPGRATRPQDPPPGDGGQDVAGVQVGAGGDLVVDDGRDGAPAVVVLRNARPGGTAGGTLRIRNRTASGMDLGVRVVSVDDTPGPLGGLLSRSLRLDLREPGAPRAVVRGAPVALRRSRSRSLGTLQARGTLRLDLELAFLDGGTPRSPTAGDNLLQGSPARVVLEITGRTERPHRAARGPTGSVAPMAASTETSLDQLCVDTIRTLSMDAVQAANSGHPGMPMAMAPAAYVLYAKVMQHDPADPDWPDRDRFVLSAGHGSMLLYSVLHLAGYGVSLDDLKRFRQWGSLTPGHPERDRTHVTPGVEVTTGPLGQGFANGVGMAMAERFLRERYGSEVMDHFTYAIVSDGDLMEGIASEAASLAGHLGLGRLVYLYDDNDISLDGPTSLSFSREDVTKRFEAYGWHVLEVHDANDLTAIESAIDAGKKVEDRPTLVHVKSIIGYPAPNKQGTSKAHGAPLGEDEVRAAKEALGWDPEQHFHVPDGVPEAFAPERGAEAHAAWRERFAAWRETAGDLAQEWELAWEGGSYGGRPLPGLADALRRGAIDWGDKGKIATRGAGGKAMAAFESFVPTMVGGAADLSESTKTEFPGQERFTAQTAGRNVFFGVREHAMGGAVNGMAAHGGIVRPYGSTFLQFADYMRGAIRLSALTGLRTAWVFTHDSVALGEDGPTHQPVEHLAALRAIPGLVVLRPADANETAEAWRVTLEDLEGPAAFALSRQDLPVLDVDVSGVGRGAYVLRPASGEERAVIVGTGAEVHTALAAADLLEADGIGTRVVSMPSWELFAQQDDAYRAEVLPQGLPSVSVEAGVSMGWERWVDRSVAIDRFGASAPGAEVLEHLGITPEATAAAVRDLLR